MREYKQTTIVVQDTNKHIRRQIEFIKTQYQGWKTPTISMIVRELVNEKYNQLKNEKI